MRQLNLEGYTYTRACTTRDIEGECAGPRENKKDDVQEWEREREGEERRPVTTTLLLLLHTDSARGMYDNEVLRGS